MIEDLFNNYDEDTTPMNNINPFRLGTIKGGKVKFDGEDTTSHKNYKKLNNITLNEDDRVLLAKVSGTFIILGKLT